MLIRRLLSTVALVVSTVSCSSEPAGPEAVAVRLAIADGNLQYVLPGQTAELPLLVQATDETSGKPVADIEVTWTVSGGAGATVTVVQASTDGLGIASIRVRAGPGTGVHTVEARAPRLVGPAPSFQLFVVDAPVIESVSPMTAVADETVTITGRNFGSSAEGVAALFGGLRGVTLNATPTQLQVQLPSCALTRDTGVRVALGAVTSNTVPFQTVAAPIQSLDIERGTAIRFDDPAGLQCIPLRDVPAGSRYLLLPQNARETATAAMRYELSGIATGGTPRATTASPALPAIDVASAFEISLRKAERALGSVAVPADSALSPLAGSAVPSVGERRDFNVLKADLTTRRVTAIAQVVSQRAVIYVDTEAPAGGLTAADLADFASLFDDPIHATTTSVFGAASDVDQNDRIIILFTPGVNRLTESETGGFIAGYFYGCDLVEASRCSATNGGEIFYSMVPDPTGAFGGVRTRSVVLRTVPAVLAHEFQHMINFAKKGDQLDVLWLSEGLAHAAEDLIGDVLFKRGDVTRAGDFQRPNYARAQLFLGETAATPLVSEDSPGTLEQRGGVWLLVKYLTGLYGGNALLERLTSSSAAGAANIEQSTGRPWPQIFSDFAVALWADGAPELTGTTIESVHTFAGFDLRTVLDGQVGGFPLVPPVIQFQDFLRGDQLAAGAMDYVLLDAPSLATTIHLSFTGLRGGAFGPQTSPQLTLMRIR